MGGIGSICCAMMCHLIIFFLRCKVSEREREREWEGQKNEIHEIYAKTCEYRKIIIKLTTFGFCNLQVMDS